MPLISEVVAASEKPFRLDQLASIARMSISTLNHRFRAATPLSPLQYQHWPSSLHAADFATPDRIDLKPARTSSEKSRGCSQAA